MNDTADDSLPKANRRLAITLLERVEALEADNEQLQERVTELESILDYDGLDYDQMTRRDKERAICDYLIDMAGGRGKAAVEYSDIRALFNGRIGTGYAYELMADIGEKAGFNYETYGSDRNNRLTVDAATARPNESTTVSVTEKDGKA